MSTVAIIYASHDGHTKKICETIRDELNCKAELISVGDCDAETIANYDVLIFGASVRYGKHLKPMTQFLSQHTTELNNKKIAFFSVNLTARKANRNTPESSNYIKKMFAALDWEPTLLEVFAGKLDYPRYRFLDKHIIRFIMWLTNGPTDLNTVEDFTNWQRVSEFAERIDTLAVT